MSKHIHILNWVPLMFCVLFIVLWTSIYENDIISFEQYVLNKQVNYAADSAIEELLTSGKLSQDYNRSDFQTYEPQLAADDYATMLCLNTGTVPTESAVKNIANTKIRALLVCVYDGIYCFYPQDSATIEYSLKEASQYELVQSPKVPYFYTAEDGQQYCLTLNPEKGYWDEGTSDSNYKMHDYDKYPAGLKPSNTLQAIAINNRVADMMNWALQQSYLKSGGSDIQVELPALTETIRGQQPVNAPTVIAVVDGVNKVFSTYLTAQSIGGAQVEDPDYVVGYSLNNAVIDGVTFNGKFYAYSSWWEKHPEVKACGYAGRYFDDVFAAAREGYKNLNLLGEGG